MSLKRSFHCAISQLVALQAHGALDYCLELAEGATPLIHGDVLRQRYKICILDEEGAFHDANQKFLNHLGLSRKELRGLTMFHLFPKVIAERRMHMVRKAIHSGCVVAFLDCREGRCFESTVIPLKTNGYSQYNRALCMVKALSPPECDAHRLEHQHLACHVWERVEAR